MSAFVGYAAALFRPGSGVPGTLKSISVPLYYRRPSGIALFGPAILAIDALIIVNTVHVTWKNWKYAPTSTDGETPALRPWWMRVAVCSMEIVTGALVASSILIYRHRMATLLSILPPKTPNAPTTARIFLQNAGSWRRNGTIFPLSACTLTRVEEKVLFLQVKGEYGGWQFNLDKSVIDGRPVASVEDACRTLAAYWQGAGGKGTILSRPT